MMCDVAALQPTCLGWFSRIPCGNCPPLFRRTLPLFLCLLSLALLGGTPLRASLVLTEIHYHPVEEPAFNADGSPTLDLYEDVHEFLEIHNPDATAQSLKGWDLRGGIRFTFPTNAVIQAGAYLVIAKDPVRLKAVPAYGLSNTLVLGPYTGWLGNGTDTVRLTNPQGDIVDSVSYSSTFPWAISADALGAGPDYTGVDPKTLQYRGRSLERVSFTSSPNDPANWLASPVAGNPSPGRPNAVSRSVPKPVVVGFSVEQISDESPIIRASQSVRINARFSSPAGISAVRVEWYLENMDVTNEPHSFVNMTSSGAGADTSFTATLPGQVDRSIVRYRFLANRGDGEEVASPRSDDPYAWHAYFVSPVRSNSNPIYDVFISSNSLVKLNQNISQNPRRVNAPDPPGLPRDSWNATEPALFVNDNVVYEMRMRYHGSRYNRSAGRKSFKFQFPRYRLFNDYQGVFETDKGNAFVIGHGLFQAAGLPTSKVRYVDLFLNNDGALTRLEQEEMDDRLFRRFDREQRTQNPERPSEQPGEFYKSTGTIQAINPDGEGPYGVGDSRKLPAKSIWKPIDRYFWTYTIQSAEWKGGYFFEQMINGLWAARGDSHTAPNPNIPNLRAWLAQNFDIDKTLTYLALINWMGPWDDTTQNHFLWQQRDGKWGMLPWDFDGMFGGGDNSPSTASIYMGENGDPNNNFRGPNWMKDSFFKAYREEYKQKLFLLNNTLLHPDNLRALGYYNSIAGHADTRFASVNSQCGYGTFERPGKPVNLAPGSGITVLPPATLQSSPYTHSTAPLPAHTSTTWIIRSANGSYEAPVFRTTTTSNLTSLPIPFAKLDFGTVYYWRCLHTDNNGHPSLWSDETSFNFGPASSVLNLLAINDSTSWKYNQTDADPTGWNTLAFNDAAWPSGPPLLFVESAALTEPKRTALTLGRITYYFRKTFQFSGSPQGVQLRLKTFVDDGCVVYLNGNEIFRLRMPDGDIAYSTTANANVGDAVLEGPFDVPASSLRNGNNVIAVEVHQQSTGSSDIVFGLSLEATVPSVSGTLLINEIAADNRGSVLNGGSTPDWVELFNNSSQAFDLSGGSLSDDVLTPQRFVFPPGTVIPAQGSLVVWCDSATNAPGLHSGFKLDNDGQTLVLFSAPSDGSRILDVVRFGFQIPDRTLSRVPQGSATWALSKPTPGAANVSVPTSPVSSLRINEWMASPATGDDWIELYNPSTNPIDLSDLWVTDDLNAPTNSRISTLSYIDARGYARLDADGKRDAGGRHLGFKLSVTGEQLGLFASDGITAIDTLTFGPQQSGTSEGRLPDGSSTRVFFATSHSPGESNWLPLTNSVVINEILAHTDPPLEDAIELFNPTTSTIDLSGWFMSDDASQPTKYRIPSGTTMAPGSYRVFYEYQFNSDTNLPTSFSLSSSEGDQVYLFTGSASTPALLGQRQQVSFGPSENGVSIGRMLTSVGVDFTALAERTFGQDLPASITQFRTGTGRTNSTAKVGPIVITEIQYHPPDLGTNDNSRDEFIELQNITAAPVALYDPSFPSNTWRIRGGIEFNLPTNLTLAPGETLLLVNFDPATNSTALSQFRATYSLSTSTPLYGPYSGKLDNGSDRITLQKPDAPQTTGNNVGLVPYIAVDEVNYLDITPWPIDSDGTGKSIAKTIVSRYGNDPAEWQSAAPSPGRRNGNNLSPTVNITQPFANSVFANGVDVTIQANATDPDGSINLVEFFVDDVKIGQRTSTPYSFTWTGTSAGQHTLFTRATDNLGASTESAPINITVLPPPNNLPIISITSPTSGAVFPYAPSPASVTITVTASDFDGTVVKVEFFDQGTLLGEDFSAPFSFSYVAPQPGSHSLTARATDDRGGQTTSATIGFTVQQPPPNQAPQVSWNLPAANAVLALQVPSTLEVTATDPDGSVAKVDFYDGTQKLGSATASPFRFTTSFLSEGVHNLTAVAIDNQSLAATSIVRTVYAVRSVTNNTTLIARGAVWRYSDSGVDALAAWRLPDYDDTTWVSGPAQLGYGETDQATTLSYGPDPNNKFITTYFRHAFAVESPESFTSLTLQVLRDDGAAAYLNTNEVFRSNLPEGQLNFNTTATANINGADENTFYPTNLPATLLKTGDNLLAVEVHQSVANSSDLSFDAELTGLQWVLAPVILQSPVSLTLNDGQTAVFSVTTAGTKPFSYQWRRDLIPIPGATSPTLTLTNVQLTDAGSYSVTLSNAAGSATSTAANLIVQQISNPDRDGDGMPNVWEISYNLNPDNPADAILDADGDGQNNLNEYLSGTDPRNASDVFQLSIDPALTGVRISFTASAQRTYTIQYRDTLEAGPWLKLADVPAQASPRRVSVSDTGAVTTRIYRAVTPAVP